MPRSSEHRPAVVPSPNIWRWPDVYEAENRAQDPDGVVEGVLREVAPWTGRDVVDVGCGAGFHLPMFAADARKRSTRRAALASVRALNAQRGRGRE